MQMLQNSYGLFVRFPNKSFLCRNIHTFMQGRETENGFYHCSDEFYSPAEGFSPSVTRYLVLWKMRCPLSGGAFFLFRPPFKAV